MMMTIKNKMMIFNKSNETKSNEINSKYKTTRCSSNNVIDLMNAHYFKKTHVSKPNQYSISYIHPRKTILHHITTSFSVTVRTRT